MKYIPGTIEPLTVLSRNQITNEHVAKELRRMLDFNESLVVNLNSARLTLYKYDWSYCVGQDHADSFEDAVALVMKLVRPEVGSPATYRIGSDSYPMTVTEISPAGHQIALRRDEESRASKHLTIPAAGTEQLATFRMSEGVYRPKGSKCGLYTFGRRESYRDPHF